MWKRKKVLYRKKNIVLHEGCVVEQGSGKGGLPNIAQDYDQRVDKEMKRITTQIFDLVVVLPACGGQ